MQEDELDIQLVKNLNEKVIKNMIAQVVVSNCLLEYQLQVIPKRMADIKTQVSKHEVTVWFLEPSEFEIIVLDAVAWKQFIIELTELT